MSDRSAAVDWPVELQEGILTRAQALSAGISDKAIYGHVRRGRWLRLHPGIYATFSGVPSRRCLYWAAVLRAGQGAALSHETAAGLWGLMPGAASAAIHVTVPSGSRVLRMPGVILHYSARVGRARHPAAVPPRTTVEDTVLDLASAAASAADAIAWAFRAIGARKTTAVILTEAMSRRHRMRWRAQVAAALDPANIGVHSILEYRYVEQVERPHGLPAGIRQRRQPRAGSIQYSDVSYEDYATLAELDGRAAHPDASRYFDTRRDNANAALGWVTLRYTWLDVTERSCEVAAEVARTLRSRGWAGVPRRCGPACRLPASLEPTVPASYPRRRL